ncbi:putative ABC transporter permease subunit [Halobacillus salinus]|uniref:ABC transporter permease n=1 Tax=Halobacillus salinus TaxID=192814 RepID=A0A4Z0H6Q4_9BACI|nr:ABC transporter permease [Halobacillus salinus]TGB05339.1 ABC transporter permease [Halobacillus salinus]
MAKTWLLIKTMVKMQLSTAGKSDLEKAGYGCLVLFAIPLGLLLLSILNSMIDTLYTSLAPTGNENVILGLLFVMMTFIFLFVSLSTVLSSFYFAEDVESFIPLPFQPYQIVMGKAAVPFLSLYGVNTLVLLPSLIIYGIHSASGPVYYIFSLVLWLVAPVVPFVLTAATIMFIMRFANIAKNKDRTKIIMGSLGFAFAIGVNILFRLDSGGTGGGMSEMVLEQNALLGLVTKFFPTAYFSSIALTSPTSIIGSLNFLAMIALSFAGILLFMTIGQQWYFKGVLGLSGGTRSTFKENDLKRRTEKRQVLWSLLLKEWKTIVRTPTFFTQILIQSLFFPVFILILLLLQSSGSLSTMASRINGWDDSTSLLVLFAFTIIGLGVNPASFSSISREGKSWFNNLYLPIPAPLIVTSKLLVSFFLNVLSLLIISIAILFLFEVSLSVWFIWFLASIVASWITSIIGFLLDFHQPKLNWTDEREVFKGRMIGFFALAAEALVFGLLLILLWAVPLFQSLTFASVFMVVYLTICVLLGQWYVGKVTKEKFSTIH